MYLHKPLKANRCEQDLTASGGLKTAGACDECGDPRRAKEANSPQGLVSLSPRNRELSACQQLERTRKQISSSISLPPGKNSDC